MSKYLSSIVTRSAFVAVLFGMLSAQSFAAEPKNIVVTLSSSAGYATGLFYKEPNALPDAPYTKIGWVSAGGAQNTPEDKPIAKGSYICASAVDFPGFVYVNYYFTSDGDTPAWFNSDVGSANIEFYGGWPQPGGNYLWKFDGEQSAGLVFKFRETKSKPCNFLGKL